MQRPDEPAELDLGHDELNTFERRLRGRPVIQEQKDSGNDLNGKKEERHTTEVVPDRVTMNRNSLLAEPGPQHRTADSFVQPRTWLWFHRSSCITRGKRRSRRHGCSRNM